MLAAAVPLIAGCADTEPFTKETFVMGTKAWITIAGMSDREAEQAADAAFREMYRIESVMSTWRSTSEISHLNTESNGIPRAVTLELYSLIDSSLYYSQRTFGAFDITVRPLVVLWGLQGGPPRLPSDEEISRALDLVGSAKVTLHSPDSTVTLAAGMQLDLAGVAKGYAVDRCVAVLKKRGVKNAIVNIGGNIFAFGKSPGAQGWNIGIRDPRGGMETVGSLLLSNEAVATSGNYENYVEIKGKR
jgi:thiamine biosynthesis lipoprotein